MEDIVVDKYDSTNNEFKTNSINIKITDFCYQGKDIELPTTKNKNIMTGKYRIKFE